MPSHARFELAALFLSKKKKSFIESKKESYPPKISWGIRFWGFRGPTTSPLETHPKKLPKMAVFGCFWPKFGTEMGAKSLNS